MKLGITTPVVNLNPRFEAAQWELEGGIEDIAEVGRAADRLGYRWVGCPEHVAIPGDTAGQRGGRYWDPAVTLGYLAAVTDSIGLLTHVTVLGYHHPLALVKRYGSLDAASGGRLILGVGVGSLRPEFELLGADYEGRGARADDALAAIRAGFSGRHPSYEGTHYRFSGVIVEPNALQERVPIWVGGRSRRSLRRALDLGDGWIPFGRTLDQLRAMLAHDDTRRRLDEVAAAGRTFDVILSPEPPVDPLRDPRATARTVADYARAGASGLSLRFRHASRAEYLEQLEAMRLAVPDCF